MAFGYIPDYKGKSFFKDAYLKIFGYPYPPRRNEAALVLKFLNPQKKEKILDIGCGIGGTSIWLAKKLQCDVVGITISPVQVEMAKKAAEHLKNFIITRQTGLS